MRLSIIVMFCFVWLFSGCATQPSPSIQTLSEFTLPQQVDKWICPLGPMYEGVAQPCDPAQCLEAHEPVEGVPGACCVAGETWDAEKRSCVGPATACPQAHELMDDGECELVRDPAPVLEALCARGSDEHCIVFALQLSSGAYTPRDIERALAILQPHCAQGYVSACSHIGFLFLRRDSISADSQRVRELLEFSCSMGEAASCANLGWVSGGAEAEEATDYYSRACEIRGAGYCLYADLSQLERDDRPSSQREVLERVLGACRSEDRQGCYRYMAEVSELGFLTKRQAFEQVGGQLQRECDEGDTAACRLVIREKLELGHDPSAQIDTLEEACLKGRNFDACSELSVALLESDFAEYRSRAFEPARIACEEGNRANACVTLAEFHRRGDGVKMSIPLVIKYRTIACEHLSKEGCRSLGELRYKKREQSTREDLDAALWAYQRGCDLGDQESCFYTAHIHAWRRSEGLSEEEQDRLAFDLVKRSCDQRGHARSCWWVSRFYRHGRGVETDRKEQESYRARGCMLGEWRACESYLEDGVSSEDELRRALEDFADRAVETRQAALTELGYDPSELGLPSRDDEIMTALESLHEVYAGNCEAYHSKERCTELTRRFDVIISHTEERWAQACEQKDGSSCAYIALIRRAGMGSSTSPREYIQYFEKACWYGDIQACHTAGQAWFDGVEVNHSASKAADLLVKACSVTVPDTQTCEHALYASAMASRKVNEAKKAYREHCDKKNISKERCDFDLDRISTHLAHRFSHYAEREARSLCKRGVIGGCAADAIELGERQPVKALEVARRACEREAQPDCSALGYLMSVSDDAGRRAEGEQLLEKSCHENSEARSCFRLGEVMTRRDDLMARVKAREAWEEGCELEELTSCHRLGQLYLLSHRIEPDASKAQSYFDRACALGEWQSCSFERALAKGKLTAKKRVEVEIPTPGALVWEPLAKQECVGLDVSKCVERSQMYEAAGDTSKAIRAYVEAADMYWSIEARRDDAQEYYTKVVELTQQSELEAVGCWARVMRLEPAMVEFRDRAQARVWNNVSDTMNFIKEAGKLLRRYTELRKNGCKTSTLLRLRTPQIVHLVAYVMDQWRAQFRSDIAAHYITFGKIQESQIKTEEAARIAYRGCVKFGEGAVADDPFVRTCGRELARFGEE